MNAISLCKQYNIGSIGELSHHLIRLDLEVNLIKYNVKIDENTSRIGELFDKTGQSKILQGYLNSILAKRESLVNIYGKCLGAYITSKLFGKVELKINDIEYGVIEITCKRGGFNLKDSLRNEFVACEYRETELYKSIQCG